MAVNPTMNHRAAALYDRLGYEATGGDLYLDGVYNGDEDWVIDLEKHLTKADGSRTHPDVDRRRWIIG